MLQQTANEACAKPRLIFAAAVVVLLMAAPASAQVQVQIFPSDMSWGVGRRSATNKTPGATSAARLVPLFRRAPVSP